MGNTNYSNPHGLSDKLNKSWAKDVGILAIQAMKN